MECCPAFHCLVTAWCSPLDRTPYYHAVHGWHTGCSGDGSFDVPDGVVQDGAALLLELDAPPATHWHGHFRHSLRRRPRWFRRRQHGAGSGSPQGLREVVGAVLADMHADGEKVYAHLLHLHWLEGRTLSETAAALALAPEQAAWLHHRARQEFHTLLDRRELDH